MTTSSLRKILLGLTGAALIILTIIIWHSPAVFAALNEGKKYEDWEIMCETDTNKKQSCFLVQTLNSQKDDRNQQIAQFRIKHSDNELIKMIQILPFGISLQAGTAIVSDNKIFQGGKFTTCQPSGCIATTDISKNDLNTIISTDQNFVAVITAEGKQMNIPFSSKGLKEGLAALK